MKLYPRPADEEHLPIPWIKPSEVQITADVLVTKNYTKDLHMVAGRVAGLGDGSTVEEVVLNNTTNGA